MPNNPLKQAPPEILTGSISRGIIKLSLPIILAMLFQTGFSIIDMLFLGMVSPQALAALGMVFPVLFFFISFALGLGVGISSYVARAVGAGDMDEAGNIAANGIAAGTLISLVLSALGLLVSRSLFEAMGAGPEILELVLVYARFIFGGCALFFFVIFCNSVMRGAGDTKTPMKFLFIATLANLILDPLLIFGWGPFPALGIQGAAIAMVASRLLAGALAVKHLLSHKTIVKPWIAKFRFDPAIVKEILRVGVPASLSGMSSSIGLALFMRLVAAYGPLAIAAYTIGGRIESVAVMPAFGMSGAVLTIVGQNVGNAQFKRATESVRQSVWMLVGFMLAIGIGAMLFAGPLVTAFTQDMTVIAFGVSFLYFRAPFFPFVGIRMTVSAGFSGAGNSMVALITLIFGLFVVGLPTAMIAEKSLGLNGVWIGLSCASLSGALLAGWFARRGLTGRDQGKVEARAMHVIGQENQSSADRAKTSEIA